MQQDNCSAADSAAPPEFVGLHGQPDHAPIGYLRRRDGNTMKDPERFDLVRNWWDKLLTGERLNTR